MKLGITMLTHNKNDIKFVAEFPCLLGHPVHQKQFLANFCIREEYGKICGFYLGSKSIVILSDLEMIKKVTKYWENLIKKLNVKRKKC